MTTVQAVTYARSLEVKAGGKTAAVIKYKNGMVTLRLKKGRAPASKASMLRKLVEELLGEDDS